MTLLLPFTKRPVFHGVEIHHLRLLSGDVVALCDADFELVGTLEQDVFELWLSTTLKTEGGNARHRVREAICLRVRRKRIVLQPRHGPASL
jgi:hypothetical protein